MKIQPINNTQMQPQYKARFKKQIIEEIIDENHFDIKKGGYDWFDAVEIPQLYTMLKFFDGKYKGKIANIELSENEGPGYRRITIDGKTLSWGEKSITRALEDVTLFNEEEFKDGVCFSDYVRMPKWVFDKMWWKYRNKTLDDIRALSAENYKINTAKKEKVGFVKPDKSNETNN